MAGKSTPTAMPLEDVVASLEAVAAAVVAEFGDTNPARVAQATSHLSTARMAIEHLHTETPFTTTGA